MAASPPPLVPSAPPSLEFMTSKQPSPANASIEEMVTCPICMERMMLPKHLNCQHAFCAHCLEDWITQPGNSRKSISCPVCRKATPIPNGVAQLPNDIGITRLLDVLSQQQPMSGFRGPLCAKDGLVAVAYCESCGHHLCDTCVDQHIQTQTLWPHLLHLDGVNCPQHSGRVQNLYCQQCDKVGCSDCMQEQHNGHAVKDLSHVAKSNRAALGYLSESLKDAVDTAKERPDMVSTHALDGKFEELKLQIDSCANRNQMSVDIWRKALYAELKQRADKLGTEVSGAEAQIESSNSLITFINQFVQEGSDYQIVAAFSSTSQRLKMTAGSVLNAAKRNRPKDYDLTLLPDPVRETYGSLIHSDDKIHRLQDQVKANQDKAICSSSSQTIDWEDSTPETSSSPRPHSQPRINNWKSTGTPRNSTVMSFDVYTWKNDGVIVSKDLHSGPDKERSHIAKRLSQWFTGEKDEDLEAPVTVFVCNKTGHMYVGTSGWWTVGYIDRYDSCRDVYGVRKVMTDVYPKSVAVCPSDGTIVACLGDCIGYHLKGEIPVTSNGARLSGKTMALPTIRSPYGIAITDDNRWIVVDQTHCLVAIYAHNGAKLAHIATFGCDGKGPREFNSPTYVCCDSKRDQFAVSDTGNNRIQVFNMSGDYLWETDNNAGGACSLKKPRGICIDGQGNILVADTGNRRIAVFDWKEGAFLSDIKVNFMPYTISIDGRGRNKAALVVGGLDSKMPVVKTIEFSTTQESASGFSWFWN